MPSPELTVAEFLALVAAGAREANEMMMMLYSSARERGDMLAQDECRLRAAAAKAGVTWAGCETADRIAEALLVERRKLHEAERQRGANHMLYLGTMENLRKALAEAKRLRATICEATAMLGEETKGRVVYVRGLLRAALSADAAAPSGGHDARAELTSSLFALLATGQVTAPEQHEAVGKAVVAVCYVRTSEDVDAELKKLEAVGLSIYDCFGEDQTLDDVKAPAAEPPKHGEEDKP